MAWKSLKRAVDFAAFLGVSVAVLRSARRQRSFIYIEADKWNAKKKKMRHLCYPPFDSDLRTVQKALTEKCLAALPLSDAVCGYLPGRHNINCAAPLAGLPFVAKIDIKDFHPSITPKLVTAALRRHGVSEPMCRIITQLVTYKGCIPQGGLSSNHIANIVADFVLSQGVTEFCEVRSVKLINFGDDTAFGGGVQKVVDSCADFAKRAFAANGLQANSKSSRAEHVGQARKFIGTCTGRSSVDVPRKKFREYRSEFRALFFAERGSPEVKTSNKRIRAMRAVIGYVRRMNGDKARILAEIFYRLCYVKRRKLLAAGAAA